MKKIYFVLVGLMISLSASAISDTLAYYPLTSDGVDQMGLNTNMTLTNAPFLNGGVYCDGVATSYIVQTPPINNFLFTNLSVSFDFYVEEILTQCVIVCGEGYRWLGFCLKDDSTVRMLYNNANYVESAVKYTTGQWYNGRISYDGTTAYAFINGTLACSWTGALTYIVSDTKIGTRNYSVANCFKGYLKNLVITNNYTSNIDEIPLSEISFFPNPANDYLIINGSDNNAVIDIYDINGKLISRDCNENEPIDISYLKEGVYFIRVESNNETFSGKFIKQ